MKEQLELKLIPYLPFGLKGALVRDMKEDFSMCDWVEDDSIFKKGAIWQYAGYADEDLMIPLGEGEFSGFLIKNDSAYTSVGKSIKPILRSLSYLTKEITHNGETFVPMVELLKIAHKEYYKEHEGTRYGVIGFEENGWYQKAWFKFMATKDIEIHTGFIWNEQQWKIQKLHEWHFDTENLIEKGLAYDINKLEQNVN